MKKIAMIVTALMAFALTGGAETVTLWHEKLPGFRKPLEITGLPEKLFGLKMADSPVMSDADSQLKAVIDKISALTVTGLVWSEQPEERRVLMGDLVMREGQAIPSYVFQDDQNYVLQEIAQNHLKFSSHTGNDLSTFNVPFGLKEALKNESSFSAGKDAKK